MRLSPLGSTLPDVRVDALPLLLASPRLAQEAEREPLDRIRMQKAVFLAEQGGPEDWQALYTFRPYDWGPFSRQLVDTVDTLVADGAMDLDQWPYRRYPAYVTTELGDDMVEKTWIDLSSEERDFLSRVRRFVTERTFHQLLRDVYDAYPAYATRSRFGT